MKKSMVITAIIAAFFLVIATSFAATYDASGEWVVSSSNYWVDQGNSGDCGGGSNDTANAIIDQNGDSFTLTIKGREYQGTVSGSTYSISTSYAEDGGITEEYVFISLSSESSGSGYEEWEWSDGYWYCSGGFDITLEKVGGEGGSSSKGGSSGGGGSGGCFIDTIFRIYQLTK